ncbi:15782_t:CDS:1, partial [Gigaspora margarita]
KFGSIEDVSRILDIELEEVKEILDIKAKKKKMYRTKSLN